MFSDDFLLGNSVHFQKKNFQAFLQEGLIEELQTHFPFSTTFEKHSFVLHLDISNYVLKKPNFSPHQALQEGKSYKTQLYIPATWLFNNVPICKPSFLFFGEIPMMTEDGNFIFNGSPRNVVGQLVRTPGIYYKVRLGKKNRRRYLVSFLSEHGCWFRLWTDQWGRIWGRINKFRKIPMLVLIRAMGFPDSFLARMLSINKYFLWKSHILFILNYFFANPIQKAIFFFYLDLYRLRARTPVFLHSCDLLFRTFFSPTLYSFGKAGRQFLDEKLGREPQLTQSLKPEDLLDAFEKLTQLEMGLIWADNIDHLQNRRVRLVNELLQGEIRRGIQTLKIDFKKKLTKLQYQTLLVPSKIISHEVFYSKKRKKNLLSSLVSHSFQENKYTDRISVLAPSLAIRRNRPSPYFYFQQKKKDKLSWKFPRTFSESLFRPRPHQKQMQICQTHNRLNLKRSGIHFEFLLQTIRLSVPHSKCKLGSYLKSSPTFSPFHINSYFSLAKYFLFSKKKYFEFRSIEPKQIWQKKSHDTIFSVFREKKPYRVEVLYPPLPEMFFQFLINPQIITKSFNQFFGLHPLSQLLDQSNPLSSAAHRRRFTSLGPGGVNRDAGLAVRDIHPSHYGRLCPIETPEGKNAGLVHSLALYARVTPMGHLQTPFLYQIDSNLNFLVRILRFWKDFKRTPVFPEEKDLGQTKNQLESFSFITDFKKNKNSPRLWGRNNIERKQFFSFNSPSTALSSPSNHDKLPFSSYICETPFSFFTKQNMKLTYAEGCRFFSSEEEFSFTKGKQLFFTQPFPQPSLSYDHLKDSTFHFEAKQIDLFSRKNQNEVKKNQAYLPTPPYKLRAISPIQILSLATSLIPFLEHDDANRALMGSNMQRQAVSLIFREKPVVGTGFEKVASQGLVARRSGIVYKVGTTQLVLRTEKGLDVYPFHTFSRSNQATCLHEGSFVQKGELILQGTAFGDRESTYGGELAIGRNLLLGYMPWEGYNFEDAVVISDRLVSEDAYTSIHIERYTVGIDHRIGEELTCFPPNLPKNEYQHLDEDGIVQKGIFVDKGAILVGKQKLLPKQQITPTFKLRAKVFQVKPPFYDNTSYYLTRGSGGRVLRIQLKFRRKPRPAFPFSSLIQQLSKSSISLPVRQFLGKRKKQELTQKKQVLPQLSYSSPVEFNSSFISQYTDFMKLPIQAWIEKDLFDQFYSYQTMHHILLSANQFLKLSQRAEKQIIELFQTQSLKTRCIPTENLSGSLSSIQIFLATKRRIQVGDKVAGRHGNKGIVSLILPRASMPYLQDGTTLDMVLNPLGVPSRMNLGQLFETLLGLAGTHLRQAYKIVPFDEIHTDFTKIQSRLTSLFSKKEFNDIPTEISRGLVFKKLFEAKNRTGYKWLFDTNIPGKTYIFDGRTGETFFQPVTVGVSYMLKLVHLVDDKIHARSSGPYALVTQQPLRGKARNGGQRLGEMEVWALEGYGAAFTLQEILTIKSDDIEGRRLIFDELVENLGCWDRDRKKERSFGRQQYSWKPNLRTSQNSLSQDFLSNKKKNLQRLTQTNSFFFPFIDVLVGEKNVFSKPQISQKIIFKNPIENISEFQEDYHLSKKFQTHLNGPRIDYIKEELLQKEDPRTYIVHNFPEAFQVLCSELQALCLDVLTFSV